MPFKRLLQMDLHLRRRPDTCPINHRNLDRWPGFSRWVYRVPEYAHPLLSFRSAIGLIDQGAAFDESFVAEMPFTQIAFPNRLARNLAPRCAVGILLWKDTLMAKTQSAIDLLKDDHRKVETLFEKFEKARGAAAQQKIVHQICDELTVHTMIEEEIFYPALRGKIEDDVLDEAYVEHDGAKMLILALREAEPDEHFYQAKVTVLQEQIEHHVKEEEKERDSMFAKARKTDVDLDAVGEQMVSRKTELMQMADDGTLPPPQMEAVG